VLLKKKDQDAELCVGNIHVYYKHGPVQIQQTKALLEGLSTFLNGRNVPSILCGDFNSTPNSEVCAIMTEAGWKSSYYSKTDSGKQLATAFGRHPIMLDYIWHQSSLEVLAILQLSTKMTPLPDKTHGSDHVPLCTVFCIPNPPNQSKH
jgi:endonuclease/exonuclease/phosphatase (EEP) superfamily protein YafD